jgi:phosphoglycolate phosphatase-like HAD superfamily hydrolase
MLYLFDIDGTLLLSGGAGSRALDRTFADLFGLAGAMDQMNPGGKTDPMIIEEVFTTRLGRAPEAAEIDLVLERYLPALRVELARSERFRLMPHVVEALDYLAHTVVLGLATGNVRDAAQAKLERAGLWQRFAFGGYGCDHRHRERLVARAIERAGGAALDPRCVVVVGDTPMDIAAARACGVRALAVATGTAPMHELAACQPDGLLATLAELPAWHQAAFH